MLALLPNIFIFLVIIVIVNSLEYSRSNNGDAWNSWGNNDRDSSDSDLVAVKRPNDDISDTKSNFRRMFFQFKKDKINHFSISCF